MKHMGQVAVALTVLAFVSTVGLAVLMLAAFQGIVHVPWLMDFGLYLTAVPLLLITATYLVRLGVAKWMLDAGELAATYAYAHPRRKTGLSIGPTEAAVNRYAAAEAARRLGRLDDARAILAEPYRKPWRKAARDLLVRAEEALASESAPTPDGD